MKMLLTVFRGTSAELLLSGNIDYPILLLPNDKEKDAALLIYALQNEHFDYVISFGQRPNIKNKVHIETTARNDGKAIVTDFDCEGLRELFVYNGIPAQLSHNAGISYCNSVFLEWSALYRETGN